MSTIFGATRGGAKAPHRRPRPTPARPVQVCLFTVSYYAGSVDSTSELQYLPCIFNGKSKVWHCSESVFGSDYSRQGSVHAQLACPPVYRSGKKLSAAADLLFILLSVFHHRPTAELESAISHHLLAVYTMLRSLTGLPRDTTVSWLPKYKRLLQLSLRAGPAVLAELTDKGDGSSEQQGGIPATSYVPSQPGLLLFRAAEVARLAMYSLKQAHCPLEHTKVAGWLVVCYEAVKSNMSPDFEQGTDGA